MKRLSIFIYALITVFILATSVHAASKGNTTIQSFSKSKKILIKQVYRGHQTTFYCESQYTQGKHVIHTNGYVPKKNTKRAHRLEWEHIVPAHAFGQSFKEWREDLRNIPTEDFVVPENTQLVIEYVSMETMAQALTPGEDYQGYLSMRPYYGLFLVGTVRGADDVSTWGADSGQMVKIRFPPGSDVKFSIFSRVNVWVNVDVSGYLEKIE